MLRLVRFQSTDHGSEGSSHREPQLTDPLAELGSAAVKGDAMARRTLIMALGPSLLRAVRGVLGAQNPEVEDVLQEAMLAVDSALPKFRGECWLVHYASRVAVQTAMNARRRASYRLHYSPSTPPHELDELASEQDSPAVSQAIAERRQTLRRLLDELPETQAEVLVLHVILGYSVEECAKVTHVPVNTVRSRLRQALAVLRARVCASDALLEVLKGYS